MTQKYGTVLAVSLTISTLVLVAVVSLFVRHNTQTIGRIAGKKFDSPPLLLRNLNVNNSFVHNMILLGCGIIVLGCGIIVYQYLYSVKS